MLRIYCDIPCDTTDRITAFLYIALSSNTLINWAHQNHTGEGLLRLVYATGETNATSLIGAIIKKAQTIHIAQQELIYLYAIVDLLGFPTEYITVQQLTGIDDKMPARGLEIVISDANTLGSLPIIGTIDTMYMGGTWAASTKRITLMAKHRGGTIWINGSHLTWIAGDRNLCPITYHFPVIIRSA